MQKLRKSEHRKWVKKVSRTYARMHVRKYAQTLVPIIQGNINMQLFGSYHIEYDSVTDI